MSFLSRLFVKDSPATADVHVSNASGDGKRKKKPKPIEFEQGAKVIKVDETHGLVLGWAIISKLDGEDYFDLQGDHIPEDAMFAASVDFMANSRVSKEMHQGGPDGTVLFAFPMTEEVAKAFGLETKTTGLMVALRPSPDVLAKFKDGTYTGFSIGGRRIEDKIVDG